VLRYIGLESGGNKRASPCRKTATQSLWQNIQAGKRSGIALPSYAGQASHVEGVRHTAVFFAQSSVLSTHYLPIDLEP